MSNDRFLLYNRELPQGLVSLRSTPSFNNKSVPAGLLKDHKTNTWAKLTVEKGTLIFKEPACEMHETDEQRKLSKGDIQIIAPETLHYVELEEDSIFNIEFFQTSELLETAVEITTKDIKE